MKRHFSNISIFTENVEKNMFGFIKFLLNLSFYSKGQYIDTKKFL